MTRAENAIEQMRATVAEIESKAGRLAEESLHWRPSAEVWSIVDNLCHIEEFVPYWTGEIVAVVTHQRAEWGRTHGDSDRLAAVTNTELRDAASILSSIRSRVESVSIRLMSIDDKLLDTMAKSRNPRWGIQPASFILENLLVRHLASHCNQIQRNIDQMQQASRTGAEVEAPVASTAPGKTEGKLP